VWVWPPSSGNGNNDERDVGEIMEGWQTGKDLKEPINIRSFRKIDAEGKNRTSRDTILDE
jgi:hypothetical protein